MTTILATLDGSSVSGAILPVVTRVAKEMGATIRLLTILSPPSDRLPGRRPEVGADSVGHAGPPDFMTVDRRGPREQETHEQA